MLVTLDTIVVHVFIGDGGENPGQGLRNDHLGLPILRLFWHLEFCPESCPLEKKSDQDVYCLVN